MIWTDPLLKTIAVPEDLKSQWFTLGSAKFQLLPKQYQFLKANEEFLAFISGYGGGKTRVGSYKSAFNSMVPNNRGLVGMEAGTDLTETAERDLLDFLYEAQLLKKAPTSKDHTAIIHCIDLATGKNLGYDSEISFVHLDDPKHVRGRHLGWFWIDEGSKVKREAWQNLIGRLRLPAFRNRYQAFTTGNPEGHNWIYDFFYNQEFLETMICGKPDCKYSNSECNRRMRLKRRSFHCTSYENYFLPPEYIDQMVSSFTDEERRRYVEASFDVFEGQIFKEFRHDLHVVQPPSGWVNGRPPKHWLRTLAVDVGGSSPWCFLWGAIDSYGNIIWYDEIYKVTTSVDELTEEALPKMKDEDGQPYQFRVRVIDYENKIAAEDLRRRGIVLQNAIKQDKAASIHRLQSYLHPNPKHGFPEWHPRAGELGSPRCFITANCRNFIREVPQQRWLEQSNFVKDEPDRKIPNHAVDDALYTVRSLPDPRLLKSAEPMAPQGTTLSLMSRMYWEDVRRQKEKEAQPRSGYRIHPISIDML